MHDLCDKEAAAAAADNGRRKADTREEGGGMNMILMSKYVTHHAHDCRRESGFRVKWLTRPESHSNDSPTHYSHHP